MADHVEESVKSESMFDKIKEKIHDDSSSSSSSDSDNEKEKEKEKEKISSSDSSVKSSVYRLFGREQPVHKVLGGGKPADVFLWKNKKVSGGVLGGATAAWVLFELLQYNLITLVCHGLIISLAILFLWSNASAFITKTTPQIPQVSLPEKPVIEVVTGLTREINAGLSVLRSIAAGHDLKKFLSIIAGLWFLSIVGSCFNFMTLFYIVFVLLHTLPVLYEKYDDKVDAFCEKAMHEIKKQYAVFDAKVLSKVPKGPLKGKKFL